MEPAATTEAAVPTDESEPAPAPTATAEEPAATAIPDGVQTGQRALDFALPKLADGAEVTLSSLRGQVVVLTFWKLGDSDSEIMMPHLKKFYQDHRDDPSMTLLTVNSGSSADAVRPLPEANGWEFTILIDEVSEKTNEYQVVFWPTTLFIDGEGIIRDRVEGVLDSEQLYGKASGL